MIPTKPDPTIWILWHCEPDGSCDKVLRTYRNVDRALADLELCTLAEKGGKKWYVSEMDLVERAWT